MRRVVIQEADFDLDSEYAQIREALGAAVGAVVAFAGLVRDRNPQGAEAGIVDVLTLEHYPGMTEKSIERIIDQAEERWPLLWTTVIHRVGSLEPCDQIVLVLVASAHRNAAFAAAEFVMDYLKTDAVFWKHEKSGRSEHWVQSTAEDHERARHWEDARAPGPEKAGRKKG